MTTLSNVETGKTIKYTLFGNEVEIHQEDKKLIYKVAMPEVICSDMKDAKYLQEKINEIIYKTSKDLLK